MDAITVLSLTVAARGSELTGSGMVSSSVLEVWSVITDQEDRITSAADEILPIYTYKMMMSRRL